MHSDYHRVNGLIFAQCWVCGDRAWGEQRSLDKPARWRCRKHADRNPCAIEGCSRSTARGGWPLDDGRWWICGIHWRIACPPKSAERRAYNRFFRLAKKFGWTPELKVRFWRYWRGLVSRGRKRCAGDIDQAEINKLFGWDE